MTSSTKFTFNPTGYTLDLVQKPDFQNTTRRDLQLALFRTAAGKQRALRRRCQIIRLTFSFDAVSEQEEADLQHFYSVVAEEAKNEWRMELDAIIAVPMAAGTLLGGQTIQAGQNLNELDPCLPAAPLQAGRLYHGDRRIVLPVCRFEAGSLSSQALGDRNYAVQMTVNAEV